jgi:large subunit ribosomal protein L32
LFKLNKGINIMAVPKRKTSKSKRGLRRSHDGLKKVNVVADSTTGEYRLAHHACIEDGTYKDRQVIEENPDLVNNKKNDETEPEKL